MTKPQVYRKESFLDEIRNRGWYCPTVWGEFCRYLQSVADSINGGQTNRRLPNPLILGAASATPAEKHNRLSEQLDWAIEHHCFDEALGFLTRLPDQAWMSCEQDDWEGSTVPPRDYYRSMQAGRFYLTKNPEHERDIPVLVEVGKQIESNSFNLDSWVPSNIGIFRSGRYFAGNVAQDMSGECLSAFILGLVHFENMFELYDDRCSHVLWLFEVLQSRSDSAAKKVGDWVLNNSNNPYLPFGVPAYGAKSVAEFYRIVENRNAEFNGGWTYSINYQAEIEREKRICLRKLGMERRNTEYRKRLIEQVNNLSAIEQLSQIAQDDENSVTFYPTRIADSAQLEIIRKLDPEIREKLARKLKGRKRGPWGAFKKRLLRVHGLPWTQMAEWRSRLYSLSDAASMVQ